MVQSCHASGRMPLWALAAIRTMLRRIAVLMTFEYGF